MRKQWTLLPFAAWLILGTLAGCREKTPAEKAGDRIENAADKTGDAVRDAGDEVNDSIKR